MFVSFYTPLFCYKNKKIVLFVNSFVELLFMRRNFLSHLLHGKSSLTIHYLFSLHPSHPLSLFIRSLSCQSMEGLETLHSMKSLWLGKNKIEEIGGGRNKWYYYYYHFAMLYTLLLCSIFVLFFLRYLIIVTVIIIIIIPHEHYCHNCHYQLRSNQIKLHWFKLNSIKRNLT